jgi:ribosomal protein L11 methyltransferase
VTLQNARINDSAPLIRAAVADGLAHPAIRGEAPFDLVLANILAGPLTKLAPEIARVLKAGSVVVLSGLLRWQEQLVLSFYRSLGLRLIRTARQGPWSALALERPGERRRR